MLQQNNNIKLISDNITKPLTFKIGYKKSKEDESGHYQYFLEPFENMEMNTKIYGDIPYMTNLLLQEYVLKDTSNTGVIASGKPGSGKTTLIKHLSQQAREKYNIPTVVVDGNHCDEQFKRLISELASCIVVFDEFEKNYHIYEQNELLSLYDGVYPVTRRNKKLLIHAINDENQISSKLLNRPTRIKYKLDFGGVNAKFIKAYCEDNLDEENFKYLGDLIDYGASIGYFSIDMLATLVDEMNKLKVSPKTAVKYLNISEDHGSQYSVIVETIKLFEENPIELVSPPTVDKNLLFSGKPGRYAWTDKVSSLKVSFIDKSLNPIPVAPKEPPTDPNAFGPPPTPQPNNQVNITIDRSKLKRIKNGYTYETDKYKITFKINPVSQYTEHDFYGDDDI